MNVIERSCITLRHVAWLDKAEWFWNLVRPIYNSLLSLVAYKGLKRTINGTDTIRVTPEFRGVGEHYEPEVWKVIMEQLRSSDVVVDVGAHIGLYTIALAKRGARLHSFEPDHANFKALETHVKLNELQEAVDLYETAVGDKDGPISFIANASSESHIGTSLTDNSRLVNCVRLDTIFKEMSIDLLKIDVEGYEEIVLKGSLNILGHEEKSPRCIFIEVHPYAWHELGTTSESFLSILEKFKYQVKYVDGRIVDQIDTYGEIVASKIHKG